MIIFEFVNKPSGIYGLDGISLSPEDLLLIEDDLTSTQVEEALGYTPEDVSNKAIDFSTVNDTLYPTTEAVSEYVATQIGNIFIPTAGLGLSIDVNGDIQLGEDSAGTQVIDLSSKDGFTIFSGSYNHEFTIDSNGIVLSHQDIADIRFQDGTLNITGYSSASGDEFFSIGSNSDSFGSSFDIAGYDDQGNNYGSLNFSTTGFDINYNNSIGGQIGSINVFNGNFGLYLNNDLGDQLFVLEGTENSLQLLGFGYNFQSNTFGLYQGFLDDGLGGNHYSFQVNPTSFLIVDSVNSKGLEYGGDYEANFTARSLITKQWVESQNYQPSGNYVTLDTVQTITANKTITADRWTFNKEKELAFDDQSVGFKYRFYTSEFGIFTLDAVAGFQETAVLPLMTFYGGEIASEVRVKSDNFYIENLNYIDAPINQILVRSGTGRIFHRLPSDIVEDGSGVFNTRQIDTGAGLSGGGNLTSDRTISLGDSNLTWTPGTGLIYNGDWESNFTPRTLVTQQYVTSEIIANAYVHPTFTNFTIDATGAQVIDQITTTTEGHVSNITLRNLSLADLGFTGDVDANNYVHPSYTPQNPTLTGALVLASIETDAIGSVVSITTRTLSSADINAININQLGVANGVATLDGGGTLTESQLPASVLGGVKYIDNWNASTNTPTLPDPTTVKGNYYVVDVAGTQTGPEFDDGSITFAVKDWVISNGVVWKKVDNSEAVASVFGRLGNIVALAGDYTSFYVRHDINNQGLTATQQGNARTNINAQQLITGGATTITASNLTANRALISNGSGKVAVSPVTSTELSYLDGVTSGIQGQLDSKLEGNEVITLTGDVTGTGATSIATTISNNAVTTTKILNSNVTYAKIQDVSANRILGQTATTGVVKELTAAEVRSIINVADGANNYVHPAKTWVDKTNLSGATVISNLTIDSLGHPTDWVTRNLTPADIGAASTVDLHDPVTIGTANGLSLVGQELSLGLASSGVTGALSGTDWDTFNGKIGGTIASGQVAFGTGVNTIGGSNNLFWDSLNNRLGVGYTNSTNSIGARDGFRSERLSNGIAFTASKGGLGGTAFDIFTTTNGGVLRLYDSSVQSVSIDGRTSGGNSYINIGANFGLNTTSPTNTLDVNGTSRIRTINNLGSTPSEVLVPSATGVVSKRTTSEFLTDIGGIGGTGTTNYIPKFTGAGTIGDSLIQSGTNITITQGTTLYVTDIRNSTNSAVLFLQTVSTSGSIFRIRSNSGASTVLDVVASNQVGILTTSPTETLDVNGTARIRTINNLGSTASRFLVASATGVISERTGSELAGDLLHNNLGTKQGGDGTNFYHLGEDDYNDLQQIISPSISSWTTRAPAETNAWQSVAYGNGTFVSVSELGTNRVMYSTDRGVTWTSASASNATNWEAVTYGNGLFVAVAQVAITSNVMTSPDGITWTSRTGIASQFRHVTYGNNLFVAVGSSGAIMTSPDGITWTSRTSPESNTYVSCVYGNGLFVAVSSDGTNRVMTSPDGITWTARSVPEAVAWSEITYGNGLFVAIGSTKVMYSSDGITWTVITISGTNSWRSITYGNGLFVAVGFSGNERSMYSSDGINWTLLTASELNVWQSIIYGEGVFVAVSSSDGREAMTSTFNSIINHSQLNLDDGRNPHQTRYEDLLGTPPASNKNVDGGFANSVYLVNQNVNGGTA